MHSKVKILVVDDDALVLKTLKRLLDFQGYETAAAIEGEEAVKLAKMISFDLILSDIRMPKMNGVKTVEAIQTLYRHSEHSCRYIFFTGFAEDEAVEEAVLIASTEVIIKPLDADKLLALIKREFEILTAERE